MFAQNYAIQGRMKKIHRGATLFHKRYLSLYKDKYLLSPIYEIPTYPYALTLHCIRRKILSYRYQLFFIALSGPL